MANQAPSNTADTSAHRRPPRRQPHPPADLPFDLEDLFRSPWFFILLLVIIIWIL